MRASQWDAVRTFRVATAARVHPATSWTPPGDAASTKTSVIQTRCCASSAASTSSAGSAANVPLASCITSTGISASVSHRLFIHLFPEFRMQQYKQNSRERDTIFAYTDTRGRMYRHL